MKFLNRVFETLVFWGEIVYEYRKSRAGRTWYY
jgi:hypothetical protein